MKHLPVVLLALLALAALLCLPAPVQSAATFTVNSTADVVDANPGDGSCDDGGGNCTLRAAIQETNALAGPDIINLPAGTYTLSIPGTDEDAAATGDLDITDDLTIAGAGRDDTVIDGGGIDKVFQTVGSVTVDISGVTIQNGPSARYGPFPPGGLGGGIFNSSGATLTLTDVTVSGNWASHGGGGIYNEWPSGVLTLTNSAISGNVGGVAVEGIGGGGILNLGTATLIDSVVSGNSSQHGGGGIAGGNLTLINSTVSGNTATVLSGGGGILGGDTVVVTNSTISGNTAKEQGGGMFVGTATIINSTISGNSAGGDGGGIANASGGASPQPATLTLTNSTISGNSAGANGGGINTGTATLTNVTISGNSAGSSGGGIYNNAGHTVTLQNTIVANSTAGDNCAGSITSAGHNLEDVDTCGFTASRDRINGEPHLLPLADNGGPTLTHALAGPFQAGDAFFFGSFAIDAGDDSGCPEADQRGSPRPVDGDGDGVAVCDIGAYEAPAGTTIPTPTPTPTAVLGVAQLPATGGAPGSRDE